MKTPALLCLTLALVACGEEFSNAVFEADTRFLAAAPSGQVVRIGGPGAQPATADTVLLADEPAELYVLTRQISLALNGLAFQLVHTVDRVVEQPPSERSRTGRVWAPEPHPLDPHLSRFQMLTDGDGYAFELTQRRRDARDGLVVLDGRFVPDVDGGQGELRMDLDAARVVGSGSGRGEVAVAYTLRGGWIDLTVRFTGADLGWIQLPDDLAYRFRRAPDGAGVFDFAFPDEQGRLVRMRSRWDATGAGRADATITEGDRDVALSECWDTSFGAVYSQYGLLRDGDPAACAFADREQPGAPLD